MVNFTIFAGGYTSYILTYIFNTDTSSLSFLANTTTGPSPSWLTLNQNDSSIFYAVNEVEDGALQSFKVNGNASISLLNTVSTEGNGPAYAGALASGEVAVMNYGGGNGRIIPTTENGANFDSSAVNISFPAPEGGVSNPHMALEYQNEIFVTDLGGNKIWRLGRDEAARITSRRDLNWGHKLTQETGNWSIHGFIEHPAGTGPRHMAVLDDYLYVIHETASTLTVQKVPSFPNGTSDIIANVSVVPTDGPADAQWFAAEILIPPVTENITTPYIYATNRNIANRQPTGDHDPRGDPIAIFEHVGKGTGNETLQLVAQVYTGLEELRGVMYGTPANGGDQYIVALGAQSGGMVVYQRTASGNLTEVARDTTVEPRTSLVML